MSIWFLKTQIRHPMGQTNTHHRPLVSGIHVKSARTVGDQLHHLAGGTLTGLATQNSDGNRVLVTNLHVMTSDTPDRVTGDEELYQESVSPSKKVGGLLDWVRVVSGQNNVADVAICDLEEVEGEEVEAEFTLHHYPNHSSRLVIEGVEEPVRNDEEPMTLTMLGAEGGEGTVTVKVVNEEATIDGITFTGVAILDCSQRPMQPGDSGAACLYKVSDRRYKMSCIASLRSPDGSLAVAFPASVAERELGITFGNRAPTANAGDDQMVAPGASVILDASGSRDPEGSGLSYSWRQTAGPTVTISRVTPPSVSLTAPSTAAVLTFQVTVTDNLGQTATDTVDITVSPGANRPEGRSGRPSSHAEMGRSERRQYHRLRVPDAVGRERLGVLDGGPQQRRGNSLLREGGLDE